jgi:hypothetical protein
MALLNPGRIALLAVLLAFMSGCTFGIYDVDPQKIEDSDQYIAPATLSEIWDQHLSRTEVIDRVGPIYPDDHTDHAIGYLRCGLPGVTTPAIGFERMGVRDCQMVGVWFDETGHAIVVLSYQGDTFSLPSMSDFLAPPTAPTRASVFVKVKRWGPAPEKSSK